MHWQELFTLFPHKEKNGRIIVIPENELKIEYPKAFEYFKIHKESLMSRIWFGKNPMELYGSFYALMYSDSPETYKKVRILTPALTSGANFTINPFGYFFVGGTAGVLGIIPEEINERYLLGVLNSKLFDYYLRHLTPVKAGGYNQYSAKVLENLPIHLPKTPEEQKLADEITKKVDQILEKVKLEQKIEKFPDEYIQEYRSRGEECDPHIKISFVSNHKVIEPVIERNVDGGGYNIIIGKKEKPIYAESEVKADYVVTALKGKSAKKDEKMQLLIPKSDAIVEEILKKLEDNKAKTKSPSVAKLEIEINELVYKLYRLNEKDVMVIEDFLKKF